MIRPKILLVISEQPAATMWSEIAAGLRPQRDYEALKQALGADTIYLDDAVTTRARRFIKKIFGARIALAWAAFRCRAAYDILYSDTEMVGLPLALFLKWGRTRPGHPRYAALSHWLSPFKKRIFFYFGVSSHIDTIIVHSSAQYDVATKVLRLPSERVVRLPFQTDTHFWHPLPPSNAGDNNRSIEERSIICVPGLEARDYATLLEAIKDLNVEVHISTRSITPKQAALLKSPNLPSNVFVRMYDFVTLRDIYASAKFVVIPLQEVDFQAGVSSLLDGMAMGKAVIVSGARGQTDVLRDPRNDGRGPVVREWWPSFLDAPGVAEVLGSLPTGLYVTPGNPRELRDAIQYLLNHPQIAAELGCNGRRVAETYFSLDAFIKRFAAAICGEQHPEAAYLPQLETQASTDGN